LWPRLVQIGSVVSEKKHQAWPPPLLKKENCDKNFNKKILKNPDNGQLLSGK
jgi:hypothetical protein